MNDLQNKQAIHQSLIQFSKKSLASDARKFFETLGYSSNRKIDVTSIPGFCSQFDPENRLDHPSALKAQWKSIDLLFQLTDSELTSQLSLFTENSVEQSLLRSYVFFAIELTGNDYPRGKLAAITRQVNQIFPMPVMILFRMGDRVSLAVINRRRNRRDEHKDVLGKVTLVHNISLSNPHPGHVDILASFSAFELALRKLPISNFDQLHAAWEEVFNVELLNKRFYEELSNWYFWARRNVSFPADLDPNEESRNSTSVIRLITRLIFCWFLKEKNLISEDLFDKSVVEEALVSMAPDESSYYKGILQNLFFATLNQQMNAKGRIFRQFVDDKLVAETKNLTLKNLYRYRELFKDPTTALTMFEDIPFLNGGLFACLDPEDDNSKTRYADGFTRNTDKQPVVPNFLFFSSGQTEDLSNEYGEKQKKHERVRGLLHILRSYKFTLAENTPVEQEIALDPELLGKVFENLLASYNPETCSTARKQTGSFYTPRSVVDFMVDESLKNYLGQAMIKDLPSLSEADIEAGLDILFAYTEKEHAFSNEEIDVLIAAIDHCNILDPACGSGAFPMGILHKLVFILAKLDPHNEKWKDRQISKASEIEDVQAREAATEAIERDFDDNALDYGRKLYLIENCIYGVDIQPIAIQISKLRFFISLVCDQKSNRDKSKNHGIRPLPNLETKFVAADTLMSLTRHGQLNAFSRPKIQHLERELEKVRHSYFSAQKQREKKALERRDAELCQKIIFELDQQKISTFADEEATKQVASWNPYDHYASASFFDPQWMFGPSVADGFDVVIGNPPYQSAIDHKKLWGEAYRNKIKDRYESARGTWDLHIPFFEVAINLCKSVGTVSFITPNKFLSASYAESLRKLLPKICKITQLTDVSHLRVFESASVYPVISQFATPASENFTIKLNLPKTRESDFDTESYYETSQPSKSLELLPANLWGFLLSPNIHVIQSMLKRCKPLSLVADVTATTTASEADEYGKHLKTIPVKGWKVLNTGTIDPYLNFWDSKALRHQHHEYTKPILDFDQRQISRNRSSLYSTPKIIFAKMALRFEGFVDAIGEYAALNCNCLASPKDDWTLFGLAVILHSRTVSFVYQQFYDGLRMSGGYLPFQGPQVRTIPIPNASKTTKTLLHMLGLLRSNCHDTTEEQDNFFSEICEAAVMETYFAEHMQERKLNICAELEALMPPIPQDQSEIEMSSALQTLLKNVTDSSIPATIGRLQSDSPDLLAVILQQTGEQANQFVEPDPELETVV